MCPESASSALHFQFWSYRFGGLPKTGQTIQLHAHVFGDFVWEVHQKQDTPLNVTVSVLGLRLRTVAKKQINHNADFNVTICVLGLRLRTLAKKEANRNVEPSQKEIF